MTYDDDSVLLHYVWTHCQDLITERERKVARAILARTKAVAAQRLNNHQVAQLLIEYWGLPGDPEVENALTGGADMFRRLVCQRVLSDPKGIEIVNRCPRCARVVRTPKARQCFWCGHDWHDRNDSD